MRSLVIPNLTKKEMGKVLTTITLTNYADTILAEAGEHPIRSLTLDNVLVDTGATLLCLPAEIIRELGLKVAREVEVSTAAGIQTAQIFKGVTLSILGRDATFDCLELPGGTDPLLGVIPLELLGLEPDLQNQRLRALPMTREQTYLSAL